VSAGVPPEQVAVAYRDLGEEAERMVEALEELGIPARLRRGAGAVRVLDLRQMVGRSFAHVCVGGMTDGRLPGREAPSALFPDEDRRRVNRFFKRDAFRLSTGEPDGRAPWRVAEDRLLFALSLAATRG
ncbi:MAG TPA: hypothetical protein VND93_09285, partial [Myxococcales bacterium]|nr:hypothetical protein [Myxococcales bacterium]